MNLNNVIPRYAFIEFDTNEAKEKAKNLNDSLFKGRQIKVEDKRKLASKGKIKEKIKRANSDNPNILAVPSLKR